jgi:cathepsin F/cysteine peptidase B
MFRLTLLAIALAVASASSYTEDHSEQIAKWKEFKAKFKRNYSASEDTHRFGVFLENLKEADKRQAEDRRHGGTSTHGVTRFSDMTRNEFRALLGSSKNTKNAANKAPKPDTVMSVGLVDWTGKYTTAVKDQGQCGSCWAFSAVEQIESDAMRQLGVNYELTEEQIVNCAGTGHGCGGGWTEQAYMYVKREGGLETEENYPYVSGSRSGQGGSCSATSAKEVVTVTDFYHIDDGRNTEAAMADYMESTGPLSVCVDADNWSSYTGGVMSRCGTSVDHCVQAVGVDRSASSPYWKVRNSWGPDWGEDGHILLAYGANTCEIASDATYVDAALS